MQDIISIFPSPTAGELRIKNYELGIGQVRVFDVMGGMMAAAETHGQVSQPNGTITINISHLPAGIYFLKVDDQTVKVVKR